MTNMSYCRFENTLKDLKDCYENMEGILSDSETRARRQLIDLCGDIVDQYSSDNED
jgi:hypothetical protein